MDEINIYNTGYGSNSVYGGFVSVDRLLTQTWNANLWGDMYLEFQADDNGQNTSSKLVETTNGVKPGIAITGVEIWTADGNNGKFWYKFDPDGERYEVKISDLSKSNALVLPADAYVSFPSGLELESMVTVGTVQIIRLVLSLISRLQQTRLANLVLIP